MPMTPVWSHDGAGTFQHVAFDIIVAVRDHRAVRAEQHTVERQRCFELRQDLIAHELIVGTVGRAGGTGREATSLDQGEAIGSRAPAGDEQRRSAHAGRVRRMLAGAQEHAFLVSLQTGGQRRERVGLRRDGGTEQAHGG
jgi:hypothetical protein